MMQYNALIRQILLVLICITITNTPYTSVLLAETIRLYSVLQRINLNKDL